MKTEEIINKQVRLSKCGNSTSLRTFDWFWCTWYPKLYLILMLTYWVGLGGMLAVPFEKLNLYIVDAMVFLVFFFNPIAAAIILGFGFLKAKVACGGWLIVPGALSQKLAIDPYTDQFDCRSGDFHLRHIGVIQD